MDTQRAIGYVRVSRAREDMISPELQRHQIEQFAGSKGIELVGFVEDLDQTGREFTKRQVATIIDGIQRGRFEAVILWKWSRWGRNLRESLIHLARVEEVGGFVYAATEDFDPKTSMGRFTRDQLLLIAELQSNQIGDTWREIIERRRRQGLPHNSMPRFGYTYVQGSPGRYDVDKEQARYVRAAYKTMIAGGTFQSIVDRWNSQRLWSPRGGGWDHGTVATLLDSGFSAGLIRARSDPVTFRHSEAIEDFDIWLTGAHQPLISTQTWAKYRELRAHRHRPQQRQPMRTYAGLLVCAECGSLLSPTRPHKSPFVYWRCATSNGRHLNYSEAKIDRLVWDWLERHGEPPEDPHEELTEPSAGLMTLWQLLTAEERNQTLKRTLSALIVRRGRDVPPRDKITLVPMAESRGSSDGSEHSGPRPRDSALVDLDHLDPFVVPLDPDAL